MKRRVRFPLLCILGAAACLCIAGEIVDLCGRQGFEFRYRTRAEAYFFRVGHYVGFARNSYPDADPLPGETEVDIGGGDVSRIEVAGSLWRHCYKYSVYSATPAGIAKPSAQYRKVVVSDVKIFALNAWLCALLLGFLPAAVLLRAGWNRFWRALAYPPGHCHTCGYDLRATPERCPECGAIPPSRA